MKEGFEWPPERVQRRPAGGALWFGFVGGGIAWFAYHALGYGIVEVNCHSDRLAGTVLGLDASVFLALMLTVVTAGTALAASVTAYSNRPGGARYAEQGGIAGPVRARMRFMSYVGTVISALFLVAILTGASALLFLLPC